MVVFYNLFLLLFRTGIQISSLWNKKASQWISGRQNILFRLEQSLKEQNAAIVWVHCASLGEFEQGREIIERLKKTYPHYKVLLTFFSPSGYEIRKNYKGADWVFYLPLDGPVTSETFLEIVKPRFAIFVKYESWHYYLKGLQNRKIPAFLICAVFTPNLSFFGPFGFFLRTMLDRYTHIFVQDIASKTLLEKYDIKAPITIGGDTRFDRVVEISNSPFQDSVIESFCNENTIVAGSTWKEDEELLEALFQIEDDIKFLIAPHEINEQHLSSIETRFPDAVRYSNALNGQPVTGRVLIVDTIGMLSKLYRYGNFTYVGGGFNKTGIHNILEAAVYGKVVFFGPIYWLSREADYLIKIGSAYTCSNKEEFLDKYGPAILIKDRLKLKNKNAKEYVFQNKGATDLLIHYFEGNLLLTNDSN